MCPECKSSLLSVAIDHTNEGVYPSVAYTVCAGCSHIFDRAKLELPKPTLGCPFCGELENLYLRPEYLGDHIVDAISCHTLTPHCPMYGVSVSFEAWHKRKHTSRSATPPPNRKIKEGSQKPPRLQ